MPLYVVSSSTQPVLGDAMAFDLKSGGPHEAVSLLPEL